MNIRITRRDKRFKAVHFVLCALDLQKKVSYQSRLLVERDRIVATDKLRLHRAFIEHNWPVGQYDVLHRTKRFVELRSVEPSYEVIYPDYRQAFPKVFKGHFLMEPKLFAVNVAYTLAKNGIAVDGHFLKPFEALEKTWKVSFKDAEKPIHLQGPSHNTSWACVKRLDGLIMPFEPALVKINY